MSYQRVPTLWHDLCGSSPHQGTSKESRPQKGAMTVEEIITPLEVAEYLKIHVKTVYRLAKKGAITGNRIGRSWRFSKSEILEHLVNRKRRPPGGGDAGDKKEDL